MGKEKTEEHREHKPLTNYGQDESGMESHTADMVGHEEPAAENIDEA